MSDTMLTRDGVRKEWGTQNWSSEMHGCQDFLYYRDSSMKYNEQRLVDIWGHHRLHNKFQASQNYIVTPCLKQTNKAKLYY